MEACQKAGIWQHTQLCRWQSRVVQLDVVNLHVNQNNTTTLTDSVPVYIAFDMLYDCHSHLELLFFGHGGVGVE